MTALAVCIVEYLVVTILTVGIAGTLRVTALVICIVVTLVGTVVHYKKCGCDSIGSRDCLFVCCCFTS